MRNLNPIRGLYNRHNLSKVQRKDMNLVIFSAASFMVYFPITTGGPLAGFVREIGAGDFFYSVLMALPLLGNLLQVFASLIIERTGKRKVLFITFGVASRFLWTFVGIIPMLMLSNVQGAIPYVIGLITLSSILNAFTGTGFFSWMGDLIPIRMRGRYLGLRDSVATFVGLIGAIIIAKIMDAMSGLSTYMVVFIVAGIFGTLDILSFIYVSDPPMKKEKHASIGVIFKRACKNKGFVKYVLFWTAWFFSFNMAYPFYNMYALGPLALTFTQVAVAGQVAFSITSSLTSPRWGGQLDKHGHQWVIFRVGIAMSIVPLLWLTATKGNMWPFLIFSLCNGLFLSGINTTANQMLMTVTPSENRSMHVAIYLLVTSLFGTMAGYLSGGAILEALGDINFQIGNVVMDRYKIIFIGAAILRLFVLFFLLPGLKQQKEDK